MRLLITGASGALGRSVVHHLEIIGGHQIFTAGRQEIDGHSNIHCDIRDEAALIATLERVQPDLVLHLAATFSNDLNEAYEVNVKPAKHILEWVQRNQCKARVLLVGSAAEYGAIRPDENPVREDRVLAPVSVYGVSKAWQSQLIGLYTSRGVNVCAARIFNLFGPGVSESLFAGRIQIQIRELQNGRRSCIEVGSLSATRDYVSTADAATQLVGIAQHGNTGDVYHVASGKPVTMYTFLVKQLEAAGLDRTVVRESPELSNRGGYDVPTIFADISKTLQLLKIGHCNAQA